MIKLAAAVVTLAMLTTPSKASECASIKADLDRLACYDKESGRTPETSTTSSLGEWLKEEKVSKLSDRKTVNVYVQSEEVVDCGWNKGEKITLIIRCHENSTALLFITGCHMASSEYNDYGKIEYRVDDEKAKSVSGEASTDNKALGLWSGARSIPVIKQMIGGKQLVARMMPYGQSPFTATFNISGVEDAVKPVRAECGW